MKIVVAMNAFKGSLTSGEATSLVATGFKEGFREAEVVEMPMADGGDGTASVLTDALSGTTETALVHGPYGDKVLAEIGLVDSGKTAIIESARASGLALVPPDKRDIRRAHSRGVGELMLWAAGRGAKRIIVGIGGTAMNDGGIGAVQAAGGLVLDGDGSQVESGLTGLSRVAKVGLGSIAERFHGIEVVAACDVNNPMVGPDGSTAVYGPQKGLLPGEVIVVDEDMQAYARVLARDLGRDPSMVAGAGAGGSLGGALAAFFGAQLVSGADLLMHETGLLDEIEDADLVITGEGRVDFQTAKGKVPYAVARAAAERSVPTLVIGGGLGDDIIQGYPTEFSAVFSSTLGPMTVEQAMAGAEGSLRYSAEQIGRLARLFAFSYPTGADEASGGVVLRETPGLEVLLILDRYGFAALPKGHLESGETLEEAAAREVFEETGISVAIRQSLGQRKHRYLDPDGNGPVQKTVHYFLMEPIGGALKPQAGETLGAMWISLVDLPDIKTYSGTQLMVERAVKAWEGR